MQAFPLSLVFLHFNFPLLWNARIKSRMRLTMKRAKREPQFCYKAMVEKRFKQATRLVGCHASTLKINWMQIRYTEWNELSPAHRGGSSPAELGLEPESSRPPVEVQSKVELGFKPQAQALPRLRPEQGSAQLKPSSNPAQAQLNPSWSPAQPQVKPSSRPAQVQLNPSLKPFKPEPESPRSPLRLHRILNELLY